MFIGREEELNFLESRYSESNGQLIVLYGRRRIGKTETLRKFCENKDNVFYSCTEVTDQQQLKGFSERILQKDIPAARYIDKFADWQQALKSVREFPGSGKKLLVIDEFPYMVKGNRAIPSILQNLWDTELKNENIMIILCGSSMSFMENDILAEKNPLYGRTTGILKMQEMDYFTAAQFFPQYNAVEKITAYAVLGGIPHYLKQFDSSKSLQENITAHILTRGSILYSEIEFLLRQELRETAIYNTVIEAVALGNTKLNDIYQKTQIDRSKLSVYLKNLIELGIICREFSLTDGLKEQANVQRGLYRLTDNFFCFWYRFVFPNLSELEAGDAQGIWRYAVEPELANYTSFVFEDVCRQYLQRQNRKELLPFHFTQIGRWWNKTDELDILAVDTKRKHYLVGECKYKNSQFSLHDLRNMQRKFTPVDPKSQLCYWLFAKNGFADEIAKEAVNNEIYLRTTEDLFE